MASSKSWRSEGLALVAALVAAQAMASAAGEAEERLLAAVHADRTDEALALLADGAEAARANRYGVLPLEIACANGNARLVAALLEAGADASGGSSRGGHTPLMVAARTGRVAPVRALLADGAEVGHRDDRGQTALMWAAAEGNADVVRLLLEAGAERDATLDSGFTAWFFAARDGHAAVIEALLADGADVQAVIDGGRSGGRAPRTGTSALLLATENGHFDLARRLLEAGADPNDMRSGFTPLHALSWVRKPVKGDGIDGAPPPRGTGRLTSLGFVDVLVAGGADVNARLGKGSSVGSRLGREGCTPFLLAARTADIPFMEKLVSHGADFRLPNHEGRTPLLAAAGVALGPEADEAATEDEAVVAVHWLLDRGAAIDVVDRRGETVMHAAAYKQSPKLVLVLAERGADIGVWNRRNRNGWTPLLIAQGFRNGNFKPSDPTIRALSKVMRAAGVEPPPAPPRPIPGQGKKEVYQP